jgi:RNase P subunit RPR2
MFNGSTMRKMLDEVMRDNTRASAQMSDEGWAGFICKECGAPLAVVRSTTASNTPERSTRGWRVTCTGCGVTEYYAPGTAMVRITAS